MGLSEIIIIMLVYGGLLIYTLQSISLDKKSFVYLKSMFLIIMHVFISIFIWFTYKGEEYQINNHSGHKPVNFMSEAILIIVSFSIYSVILILLSIILKRRSIQ